MRELSVSLSNDSLSQGDKSILLAELKELAKEFSDVTFNKTGMEIIAVGNGSATDELMYKKGDLVYNEGKWIKLSEFEEKWEKEDKLNSASDIGLHSIKLDEPTTKQQAVESITKRSLTEHIDSIMKGNLMYGASIGASASALSFRLDRLYAEEENAIAALSRIEDVDYAKEITEFLKEKIMCDVSLAVAAQANAYPNHVLVLLESAS